MVATFDILLIPLGQARLDSVDKTNLLGCEVPGRWPRLLMLCSTESPSRKLIEQVGTVA